VEGVDQHRATGLLTSAPRPRPGAISLVARYSPTTAFFPPFSLFDHCARVVRVCLLCACRAAVRCVAWRCGEQRGEGAQIAAASQGQPTEAEHATCTRCIRPATRVYPQPLHGLHLRSRPLILPR
jgi:hypothetical protein